MVGGMGLISVPSSCSMRYLRGKQGLGSSLRFHFPAKRDSRINHPVTVTQRADNTSSHKSAHRLKRSS